MKFELIIKFAEHHKDELKDFKPFFSKDNEEGDRVVLHLDVDSFNNYFKLIHKLTDRIQEVQPTYIEKNGESMTRAELTEMLQTVLHNEESIRDQQRQQHDENPEGWGYHQLRSINRYLPENKAQLLEKKFWFQFGSFSSPHVWKVDKNQIRAILRQEAEDNYLPLCPSFDFTRVEKIVDRLPDDIDLKKNPNWQILYTDHVEGSRIEKKPVGLIHQMTGDDSSGDDGRDGTESEKKQRYIPDVKFEDIGGIDNILSTIREVIELPLKQPDLFTYLGIKPHKGVMMHGPPGCGKTMIAKAVANEVNAHFISVKGPELINKYQGQSEENLRNLFDEARELQPAIIFFDEIDSIAQKRSGEDNLRSDARFVNQLLSLMDGLEDYGKICVLAATNRVELIDTALLRPGRFDYVLKIEKPDEDGCRKIFEIATRDMPVESDFNIDEFTPQLEGLSGADISFVAREGAYNALRRNVDFGENFQRSISEKEDFSDLQISRDDFQNALEKVKPGTEQDPELNEALEKITTSQGKSTGSEEKPGRGQQSSSKKSSGDNGGSAASESDGSKGTSGKKSGRSDQPEQASQKSKDNTAS